MTRNEHIILSHQMMFGRRSSQKFCLRDRFEFCRLTEHAEQTHNRQAFSYYIGLFRVKTA